MPTGGSGDVWPIFRLLEARKIEATAEGVGVETGQTRDYSNLLFGWSYSKRFKKYKDKPQRTLEVVLHGVDKAHTLQVFWTFARNSKCAECAPLPKILLQHACVQKGELTMPKQSTWWSQTGLLQSTTGLQAEGRRYPWHVLHAYPAAWPLGRMAVPPPFTILCHCQGPGSLFRQRKRLSASKMVACWAPSSERNLFCALWKKKRIFRKMFCGHSPWKYDKNLRINLPWFCFFFASLL